MEAKKFPMSVEIKGLLHDLQEVKLAKIRATQRRWPQPGKKKSLLHSLDLSALWHPCRLGSPLLVALEKQSLQVSVRRVNLTPSKPRHHCGFWPAPSQSITHLKKLETLFFFLCSLFQFKVFNFVIFWVFSLFEFY